MRLRNRERDGGAKTTWRQMSGDRPPTHCKLPRLLKASVCVGTGSVRFGFVLLIKKIRRCGGSSSSPARRRRLSFRVPLLLCTRHYRLPLRTECTDLINPTCFCLHPLSEPPGLTLGLVYRRVLPVSSGLWTSRSRRWPSARPRAAAARHVLVQYNG